MFTHRRDYPHYFSVGISALKSILLALSSAGSPAPLSILDMPCGHGRVMRMLKAAFPSARLFACDLNRPGVDFCAETFGAQPVYSVADPDAIEFGQRFDLIWVGSLLTHVDRSRWDSFINLWERHLNEGGVLVFTTHGRLPFKWLSGGIEHYGLKPRSIKRILRDYHKKGFGYQDYPPTDGFGAGYGISLSKASWITRMIERRRNLRVCHFSEAAWDNHHDVFGLVASKFLSG